MIRWERAALSSHDSSASVERLISDVGIVEGNQSQSLLSGTLQMIEIIHNYVINELKRLTFPQANTFCRTVNLVFAEIARSKDMKNVTT